MRRFMPIVDEIEGREWCELNGYIYCGTRIHKDYGYVMEYEDGLGVEMSKEEDEYYIRQYEKEQKKQSVLNETWVVASDDGINSRMYRSKSKSKKDCYTFNLSEAKKCTKVEAYQIATVMTKNSKFGREWFPIRVK